LLLWDLHFYLFCCIWNSSCCWPCTIPTTLGRWSGSDMWLVSKPLFHLLTLAIRDNLRPRSDVKYNGNRCRQHCFPMQRASWCEWEVLCGCWGHSYRRNHQQFGDRLCKNEAIGGAHFYPVTVYLSKVADAATPDGPAGRSKIFQDTCMRTSHFRQLWG
jgi:hypothetical protein